MYGSYDYSKKDTNGSLVYFNKANGYYLSKNPRNSWMVINFLSTYFLNAILNISINRKEFVLNFVLLQVSITVDASEGYLEHPSCTSTCPVLCTHRWIHRWAHGKYEMDPTIDFSCGKMCIPQVIYIFSQKII